MFKFKMTQEQYTFLETIYRVSVDQDYEVSALGVVTREPGNVLVLQEIVIPKQKCTMAHTDIDEAFMVKMAMEGKQFNFWFHTHPRIASSFSLTDEDTSIALSKKLPFLVSMVIADGITPYIRLDRKGSKPEAVQFVIGNINRTEIYVEVLALVKKNAKYQAFRNAYDCKKYLTPDERFYHNEGFYPPSYGEHDAIIDNGARHSVASFFRPTKIGRAIVEPVKTSLRKGLSVHDELTFPDARQESRLSQDEIEDMDDARDYPYSYRDVNNKFKTDRRKK